MFERILVPLDGSRLAEDVVEPVRSLAGHFGSRVTLLHVLERDAPKSVHGERHVTSAEEGETYLDEVAVQLVNDGVMVDTHVHTRSVENVAVAIDTHAHEYGTDLIAMCKHGRTGLRDRWAGSIAQQILRGGSTPIFLRTPQDPASRSFELRNIFVPLDLHHEIDEVMAIAGSLARSFEARIHLLTVVPTLDKVRRGSAAARLLPSATAAGIAMEQEAAADMLRERGAGLAAAGINVEVELSTEDPAEAILDGVATVKADLAILTTHARAGYETWLEGSVGGTIISRAPENLLLLREL